ncbi:hypothetical protein M3Y99_01618800 [Aphelenchoides fujianensis]|nr:hypothetical protein M3Y99_01618800 [Aphelenchoides fujianensis]
MAIDSVFAIGLVECIGSTVLYGSAFAPLKRRQFKDGIYSLQIRSIAIVLVGLVANFMSGNPQFYPIAMVGGGLWAVANLIVLPCIGVLGLGKCVLLYSFTNCLTIAFSLVSGFFYGVDAVPLIYAQDNYVGAPQDGLSYCFAHYMGVFVTSSLVMTVYCVIKRVKKTFLLSQFLCRKNKPYVNDELTLPSLASGGIWGVAQTLFNCSLKNLSQSVSGPIGAILPSFFASLWAVFYFREIRGPRNFILLFISMLFTSLGAVSIALSKELEL